MRRTAGSGRPLDGYGIKVAFTPLGITIALIFIGLPFVVRTLQPVIEDLDPEIEEAATSLGASRCHVLMRVILPYLFPAWLTGFALAFARAVGEYGSVVFISGNMPMRTEIAPLLIITKLEQYDYAGATAIALVMLPMSFAAAAGDQRPAGLERPQAGELPYGWCVSSGSTQAPHARPSDRAARGALAVSSPSCWPSSALFLVAAAGRRLHRGVSRRAWAPTSRRSATRRAGGAPA